MSARSLPSRRRIVAAVVLAVALATTAVVLLLVGGRDAPTPAASALRLVPDDALVVVHVSTDSERSAVEQAQRRLAGFSGWAGLRDRALRALSPAGCGRVRTLGGHEALLAIVPTGKGRAAALVVVDTGKEHQHADAVRCGAHRARYLGRFRVVGTPEAVAIAQRLHAGTAGRSLSAQPLYRRLMAKMPADRVADAWLSPDGVRRVLAPRGGLVGAVAGLLDRPGLRGMVLAATPSSTGFTLTVRAQAVPGPGAPFDPGGPTAAPAGAIGALRTSDPLAAVSRLLALAGDAGGTDDVVPLLSTLITRIDREAGGAVTRDVLDAVRGPSELILLPPARRTAGAGLVVVVPVTDGKRAGAALRRIRAQVARQLVPASTRTGNSSRLVRRTTIAGRTAWTLRVPGGARIGYLVDGNRLLAFNTAAAAAAVLRPGRRLSATPGWAATAHESENRVMSIGFLDFSMLLRAAERTGIATLAEYRAAKAQLARVRAVGLRTRSQGNESTADVDVRIP